MGFRARYLKIEEAPSKDEALSAIEHELPTIESYVMEIMTWKVARIRSNLPISVIIGKTMENNSHGVTREWGKNTKH